MDAIANLGEEAFKKGVMVEMGGLMPSAQGARVRLAKGTVTVTDGPFAEAKEVIGGYAVFNVASKEEAVRWTARFMDLHKQHWDGWEGVSSSMGRLAIEPKRSHTSPAVSDSRGFRLLCQHYPGGCPSGLKWRS